LTVVLFGLFLLTLLGIATVHRLALRFAVGGLCLVLATRLLFTDFDLAAHCAHEWRGLVNLGGLLLGFALLANHFEHSGLPEQVTRRLPGGALGAFVLLVMVFALSAALDNIAAALIGGSTAAAVFGNRIHVGYLAAIVAASNAGGSPSVLGDTTTTMIWLAGHSPLDVLHAAIGAFASLAVFGWFAARQQHALQPVRPPTADRTPLDAARLWIVAAILIAAIATNVAFGFPALGVWVVLVLATPLRRPDWSLLPGAAKGTAFLLSLVLSASMMPVESLPAASPGTAFGLGLVSSFFDNIPLTKLALTQGGYDWGMLAYCVGYGGSMLWFGSSAGVALAGFFPQAKSAGAWLRSGWHVIVGYVVGFLAVLLIFGWHPSDAPAAPTVHHVMPSAR
jgi:Na+/H+ antiporter NhaD/arsenite permease-like protein